MTTKVNKDDDPMNVWPTVSRRDKVCFRIFEGSVIALFPDQKQGKGLITSYMHVGQHSSASDALLFSRKASPEQYEDLKTELESLGYQLQVEGTDDATSTDR